MLGIKLPRNRKKIKNKKIKNISSWGYLMASMLKSLRRARRKRSGYNNKKRGAGRIEDLGFRGSLARIFLMVFGLVMARTNVLDFTGLLARTFWWDFTTAVARTYFLFFKISKHFLPPIAGFPDEAGRWGNRWRNGLLFFNRFNAFQPHSKFGFRFIIVFNIRRRESFYTLFYRVC